MPPKVKKVVKKAGAKGFKLPDPIEAGQILIDPVRQKWILGKSIGQGGFGEIYLASDVIDKPVSNNAKFVIKVEPHDNGPLFTERNCYMRIAKPENIEAWKRSKKLKHFGMPKYLGSGSHNYKGQKYRFMVMERFGEDLQKILEKHNKTFSYKTVIQVTIQILDVLEYIHTYDYIHADIKASNLLVGFQSGTENQVYLVDYGLACRYRTNGKHKEYKLDKRKAHDGTIEFTSRDAHIGVHSRRGDLEILGYNIVQWLCGKLPWEDKLTDCNYVANKKRTLMDDIPKFVQICFPEGTPEGITEYLSYVSGLTFDEDPNYDKCRALLRAGLRSRGYKDDGRLVFLSATPKMASNGASRKKGTKRRSDEENIGVTSPKRRLPPTGRAPCKPRNFNSRLATRQTPPDGALPSPEAYASEEELTIENETRKMLERRQRCGASTLSSCRRAQAPMAAKTSPLENPTPQMLEVMAKRREKSISPPICTKHHRHKSHCRLTQCKSPSADEVPNDLTPAMEEVLRRRTAMSSSPSSTESSHSPTSPDSDSPPQRRRSLRRQSSNFSSPFERKAQGDTSPHLTSPMRLDLSADMFDSDSYDDDDVNSSTSNSSVSEMEETVYYSPCGSTSPSVACRRRSHNARIASKLSVNSYSSRRNNRTTTKKCVSPKSSAAVAPSRVTRASKKKNALPKFSPELL